MSSRHIGVCTFALARSGDGSRVTGDSLAISFAGAAFSRAKSGTRRDRPPLGSGGFFFLRGVLPLLTIGGRDFSPGHIHRLNRETRWPVGGLIVAVHDFDFPEALRARVLKLSRRAMTTMLDHVWRSLAPLASRAGPQDQGLCPSVMWAFRVGLHHDKK